MMSFGTWKDGSADAEAMRSLFKQSCIFDAQRFDGADRLAIDSAKFPGAYLAVFITFGHLEGYILYTPRPSGVFEQHTGFMEEYRGHHAEQCIELATRSMFMETPCAQIVTFCPEWLPATKVMAKRMGAIPMFEVKNFAKRSEQTKLAVLYGQTAMQWAFRNYPAFAEIGAKWHDQVFSALEPHHEDDPTHNGFLGLALEMGKRQPHKALAIYNAWAELAGYAPGALLWADGNGNSLFDIGPAVIVNSPDKVIAVFPKATCPPQQPSSPPPPQ